MVRLKTIYVIWLREFKRYFRARSRIISSLVMPFFFLIALGLGFGGMNVPGVSGEGVNYLLFLMPGIIAMGLMNSSVMSGISVLWDREFGFLKEIMVAPVDRLSIAIGRVAGGMTTSMVQSLLIFIISLFIGLTINNIGSLILTFLFMVLTSATFVGFGLVMSSFIKDIQGFGSIMGLIIMPLIFLSGAFYPIDNLPIYVRVISYLDPLTYGVDGLRASLIGFSSFSLITDLMILTALSLMMVLIGSYLFKKGESV